MYAIRSYYAHRFLASEARKLGFELPEPGEYGVGMLFLSQIAEERASQEAVLTRIAKERNNFV